MPEAGPFFASAGDDIKIWDSLSLEVVKQYNYHKGNVKDLSWSYDNTLLCSTSLSGDKILLCDCQLPSKEKPKIVAEHASGECQTCVRISPNGRKLYTGAVDGAVTVWDKDNGKMRKVYKETHPSPITCIALNDSETHVASGSNKGDIVIRNLSSDVTVKPTANVKGQAVRGMTFSPWKHSLLGMTMDDGSLNLWDILHGATYHNFREIHKAPSMALAFSPHNDLLLSSVGLDKHLMLYDVRSHKFLNKTIAEQPLTSLTFMHNGFALFAGSSLGKIYHFDLRSMTKPVKDVSAHSTSIQRVVVQNLIKTKKGRSKSNKNDSRMNEKIVLSNDNITKRSQTSQELYRKEEDFPQPSSTTQPTNSLSRDLKSSTDSYSSAMYSSDSTSLTNGFRGKRKHDAKPHEKSSSYATLAKLPQAQGDDPGGVFSPLRDNYSVNSADTNLSAFPQDPAMLGFTMSSSSDTIGSYYDDVLSPIGGANVKPRKSLTSAAAQVHSKTSPHPLRESHNFSPDATGDKGNSLITSGKSRFPPRGSTDSGSAASSSHSSSTPISKEVSRSVFKDKPEINQQSSAIQPLATDGNERKSKIAEPYSLRNSTVGSSSASQPVSSTSNAIAIPQPSNETVNTSSGSVSAVQYQAEYLKNTVKEMVDELGDNLRSQINEQLAQMIKLFMHQEDVIRAQRCDVNQKLLQEVERLKEENERLRRKY